MTGRQTHAYCPACKEESAIDAERHCLWCGGETQRGRRRGKPKGVYGKLSDDHLRALHRFHLEGGHSVRALGRRIWDRAGFASAGSAAMAISTGFHRLGLPVRTQAEGTARSNKGRRGPNSPGTADRAAYKRWLRTQKGGRRRCQGTKLQPPEKGRPCKRWASRGSDFCRQHDVEKRAAMVAQLAEMRKRIGAAA